MLLSDSKLIFTVITIGLLTSIQASFAAPIIPIKFDKGSLTSSIQGVLSVKQNETWYQFKAQQGQFVVINISGLADIPEMANTGVLYMPNGEQDGTKGGIIYQGCLPKTGSYKLRIARNLMASEGGRAGYKAELVILPLYASEALC